MLTDTFRQDVDRRGLPSPCGRHRRARLVIMRSRFAVRDSLRSARCKGPRRRLGRHHDVYSWSAVGPATGAYGANHSSSPARLAEEAVGTSQARGLRYVDDDAVTAPA